MPKTLNPTTDEHMESPALPLRHRITFATSGPLAHISVLDLSRVWERSLRRAGVPLRYSQGFNPRPKMQLASPLPTGCGGAAEWLDIWLEEPWESARIAASLSGKTPESLTVLEVTTVPESEPPLSERLIATETEVLLRDVQPAEIEAAVTNFMAAPTVLRPGRGKKRGKNYDLRPLVKELTVESAEAPWSVKLLMGLAARPGATGRPDEVLSALGLESISRRCTRLRLILASPDTP